MYSINRRLGALLATLVVVIAVTGCAESSRPVATGKGDIRGINSIVTSPEAVFLIEERVVGNVNFKQSSDFRTFDDLNYNFNFDAVLPGSIERERLATRNLDVEADIQYTIVLTGSIANPATLYWEDPIREWDGTETVAEIVIAHLAPSVGEVDIYFAVPGTTPVRSERIGTLTNGNRLALTEFPEDGYELIVTPVRDPGTFIFQSVALDLSAQTRSLLAMFDGDPTLPGNVGVNFIIETGLSTTVPDVNFPPQLRTMHAALGTDSYDGYFENDFADKIYSDIGFQGVSPYVEAAKPTAQLTLTQVGNVGAIIHEEEVNAPVNTKGTIVLTGPPGDLTFHPLLDSARPIETFATLRFLNASFNTDALDIYVLEPGTPIDDDAFARVQGIPSNAESSFVTLREARYELTATLANEKTPVSAPLVLDLANGDVMEVVTLDTVDPNIVDFLVIENHSLP